jgi:hypothetical protein
VGERIDGLLPRPTREERDIRRKEGAVLAG